VPGSASLSAIVDVCVDVSKQIRGCCPREARAEIAPGIFSLLVLAGGHSCDTGAGSAVDVLRFKVPHMEPDDRFSSFQVRCVRGGGATKREFSGAISGLVTTHQEALETARLFSWSGRDGTFHR